MRRAQQQRLVELARTRKRARVELDAAQEAWCAKHGPGDFLDLSEPEAQRYHDASQAFTQASKALDDALDELLGLTPEVVSF